MAAVVGTLLGSRRQRVYKEYNAYFDENLTTQECRERYRFSPHGIDFLCEVLGNKLESTTDRSHALSVREKVLLALRYYASGSFMQAVGDTIGRDKSTVSRTVTTVTDALCDIKDTYICWPADATANKKSFYHVAGFPNVIGCIDGTHIRILKPGGDRQRAYINRKRFPSINVMGVVDHTVYTPCSVAGKLHCSWDFLCNRYTILITVSNVGQFFSKPQESAINVFGICCEGSGRFISVNAKWPGSAHDSFVFRSSALCHHLDQIANHLEDGVILGDSGTADNPRKESYNRAHCRTRVAVEMTFGSWKRRFGILHGEVRLTPEKASRLIVACAVLHNIAVMLGEPDFPDDNQQDPPQPATPYNGPEDGSLRRNYIAQHYF